MTTQQANAQPGFAAIVAAGHLRVGLFPSFFYGRDEKSGEFTGWGIEMARLLAARLGVSMRLIEFASPPAVVDALRTGACDVAFLGIAPERAGEVDFSPPWARADFTFLVPAGGGITSVPDADRPGTRVAVVRNHAMETALRGKLIHASTVLADTPDAAFELLQRGGADVLAGIRPGLVAFSSRAPGSRVLADCYGANVLGMAVAKGRADFHRYISAFVTETAASGAAQDAAERVGMHGLEVLVPAGPR